MPLFKRKTFKIIKAPNGDPVKVSEAFKWHGITYKQIDNAFQMSTGRALCAITFYDEFRMRCDYEYLDKHCRAIDILLNNPKEIKIGVIATLHENLKERLKMAPYPDHIYKLASVMFFDATEDPFSYDFGYNAQKIKEWKEDPEMLPFLVEQPLRELTPFGGLARPNLETYFRLKDAENAYHNKKLDEILSIKPLEI